MYDFLKKSILYFIFALFLILAVFLLNNNPLLLWDEPVYLSNAKGYLEETIFQEDFRFPFLELYIAGVWSIFGSSVLVAQILMILFSLATLFIFFKITQFFIKDYWIRISLLAFFAFSRLFLFWSFRIYTDIPSIFFFLLSWYLILIYWSKEKKNLFFVFFSGLFTSFAFFTRFPSGISALIAFILLFNKEFKDFFIFCFGGLVIAIPWFIRNYLIYNNPLWDITAQAKIISEYTSWEPTIVFLKFIILSFGWMLIFIFFSFRKLYDNALSKPYQTLMLFLSILIPYYLFFVNLKLERYVLAFFPFFLLLIGIGFERILDYEFFSIKKRRILIFCIFFFSLILVIFSNGLFLYKQQEWVSYCNTDSAFLKALDFLKVNVTSEELVISNSWPWYAYYGDLQVVSTHSSEIDDLLVNKSHAWLFLHEQKGISYSQNLLDVSDCIKTLEGVCKDKIHICYVDENFN